MVCTLVGGSLVATFPPCSLVSHAQSVTIHRRTSSNQATSTADRTDLYEGLAADALIDLLRTRGKGHQSVPGGSGDADTRYGCHNRRVAVGGYQDQIRGPKQE